VLGGALKLTAAGARSVSSRAAAADRLLGSLLFAVAADRSGDVVGSAAVLATAALVGVRAARLAPQLG